MTDLTKPVKRGVRIAVYGGDEKAYVVTIYPGGRIDIRERGRRKEFDMSLAAVYRLAVMVESDRQRAEKKKAKAGEGLF
jgi:hypothetical protein